VGGGEGRGGGDSVALEECVVHMFIPICACLYVCIHVRAWSVKGRCRILRGGVGVYRYVCVCTYTDVCMCTHDVCMDAHIMDIFRYRHHADTHTFTVTHIHT